MSNNDSLTVLRSLIGEQDPVLQAKMLAKFYQGAETEIRNRTASALNLYAEEVLEPLDRSFAERSVAFHCLLLIPRMSELEPLVAENTSLRDPMTLSLDAIISAAAHHSCSKATGSFLKDDFDAQQVYSAEFMDNPSIEEEFYTTALIQRRRSRATTERSAASVEDIEQFPCLRVYLREFVDRSPGILDRESPLQDLVNRMINAATQSLKKKSQGNLPKPVLSDLAKDATYATALRFEKKLRPIHQNLIDSRSSESLFSAFHRTVSIRTLVGTMIQDAKTHRASDVLEEWYKNCDQQRKFNESVVQEEVQPYERVNTDWQSCWNQFLPVFFRFVKQLKPYERQVLIAHSIDEHTANEGVQKLFYVCGILRKLDTFRDQAERLSKRLIQYAKDEMGVESENGRSR